MAGDMIVGCLTLEIRAIVSCDVVDVGVGESVEFG